MPPALEGRLAAHQRGRLAFGGPLADHSRVKGAEDILTGFDDFGQFLLV